LIYKEGKSTTKGNRRKREKALAWSNSVLLLLLLFFFLIFPLTWWCLPPHPLCHCLSAVSLCIYFQWVKALYWCSFYLSRCEKAEWNNNNKKKERRHVH
jgi:hypothetical protein